MKHAISILIITLTLTAVPMIASAAPLVSSKNPIETALTWSIVNLAPPQARASLLTHARNWFKSVNNQPVSSMGFYLGQAEAPPRSVVGWDYRQNLVANVRYGIYLINRF
ncbi:hypothetical protein [Acidihalobacter ferrooxydans]|uniref:Uncharacterized protein n=1 Tax=Acidihalobacter ferrooxydans TaxID=1765967 RepID=A0A1P8UCV2_9GAMM|nr:hypothetical protein [Acidihalobacter ferrooxydans]APZ41690.1 hypothetical protein BW247_00050 [Acidihalobacter ferrooxydans]